MEDGKYILLKHGECPLMDEAVAHVLEHGVSLEREGERLVDRCILLGKYNHVFKFIAKADSIDLICRLMMVLVPDNDTRFNFFCVCLHEYARLIESCGTGREVR